MPTRQENLEAALDNIAERLRDITENPKPSYSIDGQSVSWTEYFEALTRQFKALQEGSSSTEVFEIRSIGRT